MKRLAVFLSLALLLCGLSRAQAGCDKVGHIAKDALLYHGSPAALFDWRNTGLNPPPPFGHPDSPDGPAWFALNKAFSLHAAVRYTVGTAIDSITLYTYRVSQQGGIAALICDDHLSFKAVTQIAIDDDVEMAKTFCATLAKDQYNAYEILQDQVRHEPEVIICHPAGVIKRAASEVWTVHHNGPIHVIGRFDGNNTPLEAYALDLSNNDLSNFKQVK
jgi:hypothetical protein